MRADFSIETERRVSMIDPRKVRLMTKLAVYERGVGKQALKVNRYSKRTYVNIKQIESILAVSAAYVLGVVLYCFGIYTDIIAAGLDFPWKKYLIGAAVLYGIVFIINFIVTRIYYSRYYDRMHSSIKQYDRDLYRLGKYISRKRTSVLSEEENAEKEEKKEENKEEKKEEEDRI